MPYKTALIRVAIVLVCLLGGVVEFVALQRAHRRLRSTPS